MARYWILSTLVWSLAAIADPSPSDTAKPSSVTDVSALSSAASVARGDVAFQHYCALCHGKTGDGNGRAAKLHNPRPANLITSDKNAAYKELIIRRGGAALGRSPAMPPWTDELTEEQITDLVNFLQTLMAPRVAQDAPAK